MTLSGKLQVFIIAMILMAPIVLYFLFILGSPNKAMKELPIGSSYKDLLAIAGPPSYETDGSLWVEPEYKKSPNQLVEGCVRELWYENWGRFIPSKFSFCFDHKGKLIHKYHWLSW